MSIGITDSMWQQLRSNYNSRKLAALNSFSDSSLMQSQNVEDQIDIGSNTCTDGADDGHIGFFSKAGNFFEGIGNSVVGMAKNIVKHPLKTLAVVGACCIPVAGPVIAGGLAAYGVYQGAKTIYNGVQVANSATTDAEAKAAWENIGSGTFTTAASVVALKGSASVLKNQLNGGSEAASLLRDNWKTAENKGELLRQVGQKAAQETKTHIEDVGKATVGKVYNKGKSYAQAISDNGFKGFEETFKADWDSLANKATNAAGNAGQKIGEKIDSFRANKIDKIKTNAEKVLKENDGGGFSVQNGKTIKEYDAYGKCIKKETATQSVAEMNKANFDKLQADLKAEGYTSETLSDGSVKLTKGDNVIEYSEKGIIKSETTVENGVTTKTVYNSKGNKISESNIYKNNSGGTDIEETYTKTYNNKGKVDSTIQENTMTNSDGSLESKTTTVTKGNKTTETTELPDSKTTITKKTNGDYEYVKSKETSKASNPFKRSTKTSTRYNYGTNQITSKLQKAWARYKTSAVSPTIDKFIDMQVQLGNITVSDVVLMDLEALLLDKDD